MPSNIFELSPDTRAIADRLSTVPHGATIGLGDLSAVIGRDIRQCRHLLYAAYAVVRRETGAIFGSVRNVGYQRLSIDQVPAIGSTARKRVRRTARRASRDINASLAKANDVSNAVRLKANAELSMLGLVEHMARDSAVKPSEDMNIAPQPVAVAARAFLERIGGRP